MQRSRPGSRGRRAGDIDHDGRTTAGLDEIRPSIGIVEGQIDRGQHDLQRGIGIDHAVAVIVVLAGGAEIGRRVVDDLLDLIHGEIRIRLPHDGHDAIHMRGCH